MKFKRGDLVTVSFALGASVVRLLTSYRSRQSFPLLEEPNEETVWHVEDEKRKHGDFVGESFMTKVEDYST